jgi:hypothetical protein
LSRSTDWTASAFFVVGFAPFFDLSFDAPERFEARALFRGFEPLDLGPTLAGIPFTLAEAANETPQKSISVRKHSTADGLHSITRQKARSAQTGSMTY